MSVFAEFLLVAAVIYLWESTLWLPLRSVALRRRFFSRKWRVVRPGQWMSTKDLGLVPMLPIIPDTGLAPCQAPPLLASESGAILAEVPGSDPVTCNGTSWDAFHENFPRLTADGVVMRISSPRSLDFLRRAKKRGLDPADAIVKWWRFSLSPGRAIREWRRWQRVSSPLEILCQFLTVGFFGALPIAFLYSGLMAVFIVVALLWIVMILIASRLWWTASRVYPTAKSQLRMDAVLSALVPFHAMRAFEIASVHAMAATHPAALLIGHEQTDNPWFASFIRELLYPRPEKPHDAVRVRMILPAIENSLSRIGKKPSDLDSIPDRSEDPEANAFCPRCHSLFSPGVISCTDCRGIPLTEFPK